MISLGTRWRMKLCWILLTLFLMGASSCQRRAHPDLRQELLTMLEHDQRIRQEHQTIFVKTATPPDKVFVPKEEKEVMQRKSLRMLKNVNRNSNCNPVPCIPARAGLCPR
jgi:hypothetical protein